MKILVFINIEFDYQLDVATWLEICNCLAKNNKVLVYGRYRHKEPEFKNINFELRFLKSHKVPFINRFIFYFDQLIRYEQIVKDFKPDIVLFCTNNYLLLNKAITIAKKDGHKLVYDIRTLNVNADKDIRMFIDNYMANKSLDAVIKHFDGISYITEEIRKYLCEYYDLKDLKYTIWSSAVDISKFSPYDGIKMDPSGHLKLIYHGVVAKNRGIDNVIKALALLNDPLIKFDILGSGDGLENLKSLTDELGLNQQVSFLGHVLYKEVPGIIRNYDAGVIPLQNWPGWNTSSPIKLFEYFASGMPVIVTKIPAHTNVIGDEKFVFWADNSTPEDISFAIKEALQNRNNFVDLGKQARSFVEQKYTWEIQAQKLEKFFQSLK